MNEECKLASGPGRDEIPAGHLLGLRATEQEKQSRGDISEDTAVHFEIPRPIRDVDEVDQIRRVSSVG